MDCMDLVKYPDQFSLTVFRVAGVIAMLQACSAFAQGALIISSSKTLSYAAPELPPDSIRQTAKASTENGYYQNPS